MTEGNSYSRLLELEIELLAVIAALLIGFGAQVSFAQSKGYVTSRPCPHSCKTIGLAKNVCKDWREGNTCYVEDLTRRPGPALPPLARPTLPPYGNSSAPYGNSPGGYEPPYGEDYRDCRNLTGRYISRPRISIYRVDKTGNFFDNKFKVEGEVEGVCVVEAGYFSRGRKRQSIPIRTQSGFQRFRFSVVVEGIEDPEIRAYNVNGDSEVFPINPNDF